MTIQDNSAPTCLACGSGKVKLWASARDIEYYTSTDLFAYNRCDTCGALSIAPVPDSRLAEIYPANYYSFTPGKAGFAEKIKQVLDRHLFRKVFRLIGDRTAYAALDVGGGSGWLLSEARQVEPRLTRTIVVDIDDKAEAAARQAGHYYFLGRIEDFQTDEKFDLILMLNLIEHVRDPVAMLEKAGSMLAHGGRILIKTPNTDSLDARLFRHKNWGGYHCPRHWVLFDPPSFRTAAARAGVEVEHLSLTQGAPFWTWSVLKLLKDAGIARIDAAHPAWQNKLAPWLMLGFAAFDFLRRPFMNTSQMFIILKNRE